MSWMNVAKSYGDLFYTPKSLPGCFCKLKIRLFSNEITAKNKAVF